MTNRFPGQAGNFVMLAMSLMLLTACSSPLGMKSLQPEYSYVLEDLQPPGKALDANGASIRVSAPVAAPGYNGVRLLYLQQPHQLASYAYHRWVDAPARMLEPLLVHSLEGVGRFRVVAPSHVAAHTELRLDSELLYLHQRFSGQGSQVELGLRVDLVEMASANVLDSEVFRVSESVQHAVPYGAVAAANRAVTRLLQQLREWTERISLAE